MRKSFLVKSEMLGPEGEEGCVQQGKFLNRVISWEADGLVWEPDPRHGEIIIRQLGLEGGRSLKIPGVKEESRRSKKELQEDVEEVVAAFVCDNNGSGRVASPADEPAKGETRGWSKTTMKYVKEYVEGRTKADHGNDQMEHAIKEAGSR